MTNPAPSNFESIDEPDHTTEHNLSVTPNAEPPVDAIRPVHTPQLEDDFEPASAPGELASEISDEMSDEIPEDEHTPQSPQRPETDIAETVVPELVAASGSAGALRGLVLFGVPFALAGLIVGLRFVTATTLPHILVPGDYLGYQDVIDGLPVPHLLDWNTAQMELLSSIRDVGGAALWIASLLIFGPLWLYAVRQINPTFRLFRAPSTSTEAPPSPNGPTGEQSTDRSPLPHSASTGRSGPISPAIELHGLIKAGSLLVVLGLPVALIWIMVPLPEISSTTGTIALLPGTNEPLIGQVWLIRIVLLCLIFWVGFHRNGLAGDFAQPEWNQRRHILTLTGRACLFGLLTFLLCRFGLPQYMDDTLLRLQTLGALNIARWNWIAGRCLISFGAIGFALGALFALFERKRATGKDRFLFGLATLLAFLLAWSAIRPFTPSALAVRYDITPALLKTIPEERSYRPDRPNSGVPDSREAAAELAKLLHLAVGTSPAFPGHTVVMFREHSNLMVFMNGYTLDGLTPDPASVKPVQDFLERRGYETALSWPATNHLFNVAMMQFDATSAMDACFRDLTHNPHNTEVARTLMQMLSVCAATPENLTMLDRWADPHSFAAPTRDTKRLLGELYRRFGQRDKALAWYRKAEMPSSFLKRVSEEKVMFHAGELDGTLRLNGRPLAGVRVGVIPIRMNGLTAGLDPIVYHARDQLFASDPFRRVAGFDPVHPVPYRFRFLSGATVTDAAGHYHISGLTEGEYTLICTLPADVQPALPADDRLEVGNRPLPFTVNYDHPLQAMGLTELTYKNR